MQMEISTKDIGKREKLMDMVFTLIKMVQCIKVNGQMINIMEKELKLGTMDLLSMRESLLKPKRQEKEDLNLMATTTREILRMVSLKDKENTISLILVKFISENSMRTIL